MYVYCILVTLHNKDFCIYKTEKLWCGSGS